MLKSKTFAASAAIIGAVIAVITWFALLPAARNALRAEERALKEHSDSLEAAVLIPESAIPPEVEKIDPPRELSSFSVSGERLAKAREALKSAKDAATAQSTEIQSLDAQLSTQEEALPKALSDLEVARQNFERLQAEREALQSNAQGSELSAEKYKEIEATLTEKFGEAQKTIVNLTTALEEARQAKERTTFELEWAKRALKIVQEQEDLQRQLVSELERRFLTNAK